MGARHESIEIEFEDGLELGGLWTPGKRGRPRVVLAHGAGSGMDAPHLEHVATGLGEAGFGVLRFEFAYRAQGRKAPDRMPRCVAAYACALAWLKKRRPSKAPVAIGGHSMGGRVATHVVADGAADEAGLEIAALLLLAYPMHPPGRPEKRRDEHLDRVTVPVLWLKGERDTFATPEVMDEVTLPASWTVHEVAGADHSFKVRKKDGRTVEQVREEILEGAVEFLGSL